MHTKMPFIVMLFLVPTVSGQTDKPIQGIVVTRDGQPIEGVSVYGGLGKCCPVRREQTITDNKGAFALQHPGTVIHFFKESFQPHSIVIREGSSALRIQMRPATNAMRVPDCGRVPEGQKRIGFGQYGPQFMISEQSVDVQGGIDVDHTRYVIKRKQGQSFMELWLGPTAISVDPDDDQFIDSIDFSQRLLLLRNAAAGLDSRGNLRGGGSWRQTVIAGIGGAVYNKASTDDAVAFDQVIDSVCFVPFPSK